MASSLAFNCRAGVQSVFVAQVDAEPGRSVRSSFLSPHLAGWPWDSQARICLFCFRILVFQKSPTIYHSSEQLWVDAGWMLLPPSSSSLSLLLLPPTLGGNQEKQDSTCPSPWRLLRIAGIVTISGSNRTIYRAVNTNCSVEWQKIMK